MVSLVFLLIDSVFEFGVVCCLVGVLDGGECLVVIGDLFFVGCYG